MENMKNLIKEYADLQYPIVGDYNTKRYGNDRMKNYFLYQNLREIDDSIQTIENPESCSITRVYGFYNLENGTCSLTWRYYSDLSNNSDIKEGIQNHEKEPNFEPLTESDKVQVLAVLKQIRADFEKRLNNWWKKYGFEKLHTWTYWADA